MTVSRQSATRPTAKPLIVVTGGGTGGHIMPTLAVAAELVRMGADVHYIGGQNGPERALAQAAGLPFHPISAGKLRRYFSWENVVDAGRVLLGLWQSWRLLRQLRPTAVFAKGGYVCLPVALVASFLEIPLVAHESDAVMGLANRLIASRAKVVCVGFPMRHYPANWRPKLRYTGNPIRSIFYRRSAPTGQIAKRFRLSTQRPTILVIGGSQGSLAINRLVFDALADWLAEWQMIHLTGPTDYPVAMEHRRQLSPELAKRYRPYDFVGEELPAMLTLADLVISRSSASVLAELAALGRPAILIPLPTAAGDHQRANAVIFASKGAAVMVEEKELTGAKLRSTVKRLLADRAELNQMGRAMRAFASPRSAAMIAEITLAAGDNTSA